MFWPIFYSAVGFWSIALAGGLYWGRRYVRAIEARAGSNARIAELEARLIALETGRPEMGVLARHGAAPSTPDVELQ
jgi:hypothetical protein